MDAGRCDKDALIARIVAFIKGVGLAVAEATLAETTFLPGVQIRAGGVEFDRDKLLYPGDLLHEAGHLAVCAAADRAGQSGNVLENDPARNGEEIVAMLWSYAACIHLGLPPRVVFHSQGYKGASENLLACYERGDFIGLPLLVWMGMAKGGNEPDGFPRMLRWLRV